MALRRLAVVVLLSAVGLSACGARHVRYHLPQIAALPIGAAPVRDARGPFTTLFCEVLAHVPGQWGACDDYLHPPDVPVPTAEPLSRDHDPRFLDGYRVLLVGGIFARCLDVTAFQDAAAHLREAHGAEVEHLPVMGNQDTHVIADEAAMPGGTFLARANGDHWAVASPIELSRARWLLRLTDRYRYPRAALPEAALRFIVRDLRAHR